MRVLMRLADNENPASLASRLRAARFRFFLDLLTQLPTPINILDVGGTESFWKSLSFTAGEAVEVTLLNLQAHQVALPHFKSVAGDARCMREFEDGCFDVVFSNSLIEHVGDYADQQRMANEVRRVGRRYVIQTPNKYFPVEPHFLVPGFQFLPVRARIWMLMHFNLGWHKRTADPQLARREVTGVHLLTKSQLRRLFPEARLYTERVCGLSKSHIVYHGWDAGSETR